MTEQQCPQSVLRPLQVMPIIQWDDHPFLGMKPDPEVGPLALALRALLVDDLDPTRNRCNTSCHSIVVQLCMWHV